jgi:hypothetical protein
MTIDIHTSDLIKYLENSQQSHKIMTSHTNIYRNVLNPPLPMPRSSINAPTPEIKRKPKASVRKVRQACTLSPPSAVTIWIGAFGVPRTPSFVMVPTLPSRGDDVAIFMEVSLCIPLTDVAAPVP